MSGLNFNFDDANKKPQVAPNGKMMGGSVQKARRPQPPQQQPQQRPLGVTPPQQQQQQQQQRMSPQGMPQQQPASQGMAPQQQPVQQGMPPMPKPTQIQSQQTQQATNNTNKGKKNKKGKKGKKGKIVEEQVTMDEEYVKKQYRAYRSRRVMVFTALIIFIVGLLGLAAYNVFKPTLSIDEAARGSLYVTDKSQRNWDSGVQSFLQRNLQTMLTDYFHQAVGVKKFTVDNISVERNIIVGTGSGESYSPVGNFFICYFSADVTANDNTVRTYFELPITIDSTTGTGFKRAGELTLSVRKPYSSNDVSIKKDEAHEVLKFEGSDQDSKTSEAIKGTLTNFFTLAYNDERHEVGDYYKGSSTMPLEFNGKFNTLNDCKYYKNPNKLGYNTYVSYNITLPNGAEFDTYAYMTLEKSGDNWVITDIM